MPPSEEVEGLRREANESDEDEEAEVDGTEAEANTAAGGISLESEAGVAVDVIQSAQERSKRANSTAIERRTQKVRVMSRTSALRGVNVLRGLGWMYESGTVLSQ